MAPVGAIAQLGERVLCKHEVVGSIPSGSTTSATKRSAIDDEIPVALLIEEAFGLTS